MKRTWQIFVAPGAENESLPIDKSPWHDERWASLPKEHWDLILDFADKIDSQKAKELRSYSFPSDDNEYNYIKISTPQAQSLASFMEDMADKILKAPPLITHATEEIPDEYINEEHARMVKAVAAVFKESVRLKEPFRAWVE